jgi:hypothetical protein
MSNDANVANAISDQTFTIRIELPSRQKAAFKVRLQLLLMLALAAVLSVSAAHATTYYVSKNGDDLNGLSWQNAWSELDQINWAVVKPGDVIQLDGGTTSMTYWSSLVFPSTNSDVTLMLGTGPAHSGQAIIDYALAPPQIDEASAMEIHGSGFTIAGRHRSGIVLRNSLSFAITVWSSTTNILIDHVEAYDNPYGALGCSEGTTVSNSIFHDNGLWQLGIGAGAPQNAPKLVTLYRDWIYNTSAPIAGSGLAGGSGVGTAEGAKIQVNQCVFGPKLNIAILDAGIKSLTASDCLYIDSSTGNFFCEDSGYEYYPYTNDVGPISINQCTFFVNLSSNAYAFEIDPNATAPGAPTLPISPTTVTNSIFYGGSCVVNPSLDSSVISKNNVQYKLSGNTQVLGPVQANPDFVTDVSQYNSNTPLSTYRTTNFAPQNGSPAYGLGSVITSISQLLSLIK